jgi:hypothetical protein
VSAWRSRRKERDSETRGAAGGDRLARVPEELLEAEAVEEPLPPGSDEVGEPAASRALPDRRRQAGLDAWRGEVRTAAIAAAGGLVAGAATVAAARVMREAAPRVLLGRRKPEREIVASRSFLIDVHLLGR